MGSPGFSLRNVAVLLVGLGLAGILLAGSIRYGQAWAAGVADLTSYQGVVEQMRVVGRRHQVLVLRLAGLPRVLYRKGNQQDYRRYLAAIAPGDTVVAYYLAADLPASTLATPRSALWSLRRHGREIITLADKRRTDGWMSVALLGVGGLALWVFWRGYREGY